MATDQSSGIPDPIDRTEKIDDPGEYKQHRRLRAIFDARDWVWHQREKAWDYYFEGRISIKAKDKALRMAMEKYIGESMYSLKESDYGQWYWEGHPPTEDGRPAYEENDDGELELVAVHPDSDDASDDRRRRRGTSRGRDITSDDPPVLVTDRNGDLPFGKELNVLGILRMPEVNRVMTFIGLESYMEVPDPIVRQAPTTRDHPLEISKTEDQTFTYQIPEEVTMNAFYTLNDFWGRTGLALNKDKGLPIEDGFDQSRPEDDLEYGHTETPEI